jgi:hypothetical protein
MLRNQTARGFFSYDLIGPMYSSHLWQTLPLHTFCRNIECKIYWIMEASTKISEESLGGKAMCGSLPTSSYEREAKAAMESPGS